MNASQINKTKPNIIFIRNHLGVPTSNNSLENDLGIEIISVKGNVQNFHSMNTIDDKKDEDLTPAKSSSKKHAKPRSSKQGNGKDIRFSLTKNQGNQVKTKEESHNHEHSNILENSFKPKKLKLSKKNEICIEQENNFILKDLSSLFLSNFYQSTNFTRKLYLNKMEAFKLSLSKLQDELNVTLELFINKKNGFKALYFQDSGMKQLFATFPEFLCIDVIYDFFNLNIQCYFLIIEDPNAENEIVAVGLFKEGVETFSWFLDMFKKHNPNTCDIRVVMVDKEIKEQEVLIKALPQAHCLISRFHALKAFKNELKYTKFALSDVEQQHYIDIFQQMLNAEHEGNYTEWYNNLQINASHSLLLHFNKNWHSLKHQWVLGLIYMNFGLFNSCNKKVEAIYLKLKYYNQLDFSLELFLKNFLNHLKYSREENFIKIIGAYQQQINLQNHNSTEKLYQSFLTPYAFKIIGQQLLETQNLKEIFVNLNDSEYIVASLQGFFKVVEDKCSCLFNSLLKLPCCHLFAVKKLKQRDLFFKNLCHNRWRFDFYKAQYNQIFIYLQNNESHENPSPLNKYNIISSITKEFNSFIFSLPNSEFLKKTEAMKKILKSWQKDYAALVLFESSYFDKGKVVPSDISSSGNVILDKKKKPQKTGSIQKNNTNNTQKNKIANISVNSKRKNSKIFKSNKSATKSSNNLNSLQLLPNEATKHKEDFTIQNISQKSIVDAHFILEKPPLFYQKDKTEKVRIMLSWFVKDSNLLEQIINDHHLLEIANIESNLEKVHPSLLDCPINMNIIRDFFTEDAWNFIRKACKTKKSNNLWRSKCSICTCNVITNQIILCGGCLVWFHVDCVNLSTKPNLNEWFCNSCSDFL